ncbi:MAG: cation diffusion facilitator family transporter [Actinobacteria bacterium]|nr:cation diffusion facilitator family transporter [Actinomycetota bacterium]
MAQRHRLPAAGGVAGIRHRQRRALVVALVANGSFLVVEFVGGLLFRSLALLADAAHMLSDVAALTIALVAQRLIERPATNRHSFGLQRAEVLGAQANGLVLFAASAWILYEAVRRIGAPQEVRGGGLVAVAAAGLVVNLASAYALHRVRDHSLNIRGALAHLLADAVGSVGALLAGVAVVLWRANWVDPAVSMGVALLVLWSAYRLLRETTHVLLEGTPQHLDIDELQAAMLEHAGVEAVHHLHVWSIASDVPSLSAHVVLREELSLHDAQILGDELRARLENDFGIGHTTLELECHVCGPEADDELLL